MDFWYERGVSPTTVNKKLSHFHHFLQWCLDRELRTKELPKVPWQKEPPHRRRWLKDHERETLLKLLDSYGGHGRATADFVRIALATGMRRGEILHLTLDNVEGHRVFLPDTKTSSPRYVPIDPAVHRLLTKWLPWGDTMGSKDPKARFRYYWDKAKKEMGLQDDPHFTLHACRHSTATYLVEEGVNIRTIQDLLGHKKLETTLGYAHVTDEAKSAASGLLSKKLKF